MLWVIKGLHKSLVQATQRGSEIRDRESNGQAEQGDTGGNLSRGPQWNLVEDFFLITHFRLVPSWETHSWSLLLISAQMLCQKAIVSCIFIYFDSNESNTD